MVASLQAMSHDGHVVDSYVETPLDETKRDLPNSVSESGEKGRLRSLGEGPCAPVAAAEGAQAEADESDIEVSPGYKGWINLVGVSSE